MPEQQQHLTTSFPSPNPTGGAKSTGGLTSPTTPPVGGTPSTGHHDS